MGGKKRNTAKTGDSAIYKGRDNVINPKNDEADNDPMYNKVDRFHNEKEEEFLKLERGAGDDSEDDEKEEAVMDLGLGGESSDESSNDSDDEDNDVKNAKHVDPDLSGEEELSSSDDDEEEEEMEDVRDWGKKKAAYYNGDTADLEIGQDEEDAYLEEEAAKEVQAARYDEMSEDDFVLSDTEEDKKEADDEVGELSSARDVMKLSLKDKRKVLDKQHPEFLPLLSYFSGVVKDLDTRTVVATGALFDGDEGNAEAVGSTGLGQQFLLTKALLQSTTALNLAMYLLLKSEHSAQEDVDVSLIQSHPVMARLQKANTMIEKLDDRVETKVDGLREQLDNLVKAASLMKSGLEEDDDDEDSENESEDAADDESMDEDSENVITADSSDDGVESENDEADNGAELARKNVLNEARFGLRPREIAANVKKGNRKRRAAVSDLGDDGPEDVSATASKNLATTLNAIEQRSAASKKRAASNMEALDDVEDDNDELRRGLEMMEADLGKESEDEGGDEADDVVDDEVADKNDGGFYAQAKNKSNVRKEFKKSLYQVAPKFPRVEPVVEGERALGNQIMKNRGLVAHKSKLNRNGRVKKREQYRKAIIKRKGTVRDVRTDEGHKYGGEETGIKSNLSRSRKLV